MFIRKQTHDVLCPPRKRALKPGLESLEGRVVLSTYTPSQIRSAYGIDGISFGGTAGTGAGQTIAIIEGSSDPYIAHDLAEFDAEFGLPSPPSFQVLNQEGGTSLPAPVQVPGQVQAGEECMDVEWAHAIAPGASLIVIECNSITLSDLGVGLRTAAGLPGVSVVSISLGVPQFTMEHTLSDPYYTTPDGHQGVTFVAASGDNGAPGGYPSSSPYVVGVGGTSLLINPDGSYNTEIGWSGSGGDLSPYESEPAYQEGVQSSGKRAVPDVSFDANLQTGIYVYDTFDYLLGHTHTLFIPNGGTSFGAPAWAGLIAIANQGRVIEGGTTLNSSSDPTQTLTALYSLPPSDFHDITSGNNGEFSAGPGYDLVTGLGTPIANLLVPDLAAYGTATHLAVTDQPPGSVHAKSPFTVVIAAEDATGQVDSSFDGSVKLTLPNRKTVKAHALDGVATFGNLSVLKLGKAEKIEAAASSFTSVTTDPFRVTKAIARKQHQRLVQADLAAPKKLQHRGQQLPRHADGHSVLGQGGD